ncbi:MAG: ATP-binding cassette domain-containing protein [Clostridia bacterium]|jgi:ATP-binding cassette subfamily F protein 3|nr:ATP-binding cassette domain-containing protein [Clostridia bacterium]
MKEILRVNELKKIYNGEAILKNVSFSVGQTEKIGLVGVNGSGKSTILKMITDEVLKDGGDIFIDKSVSMSYLAQNQNLDNNKTIYEEVESIFEKVFEIENKMRMLEFDLNESNMNKYNKLIEEYNEINGYEVSSRVKGALIGLGFTEKEFNNKIDKLSGGEKTRVLLAKVLVKNSNLLILDEPTNHLDVNAITWLESFIINYKGAVLIVSHDRHFLDRVAMKIIEVENKKSKEYNGNYSAYKIKKEEDFQVELKAYENNQRMLKQEEEIIKRYYQYGSIKSFKRAKSREKRLDKKEVLEKPSMLKDMKFEIDVTTRTGNDVLDVTNISKSFGDTVLFKDINFYLKREEKVAIIGANGCGKTTLLNMVKDDIDEVKLGANVKIGYYDQHHSDLNEKNNVIEEISNLRPDMNDKEIRNLLARFLFVGEDVFKTIKQLSGGEKARVSLAKLMLSDVNLLLLDEPTNHLDLASKEVLENILVDYKGTILFISHDRYFIEKIADRVLKLKRDKVIEYKYGNIEFIDVKDKEVEVKKKNYKVRDNTRKINERKMAKIEEYIEKLELEKAKLEEELHNPDNTSSYSKLNEISSEISKIDEEVEKLFEEYERLDV